MEPYSFLKYEIVVGQFSNYRNFPPNYMLIVWTTKYQQTLRFYILFVRSDLWLLDKNLRPHFNSFYKNYKLLCIWNVFPFPKNLRWTRGGQIGQEQRSAAKQPPFTFFVFRGEKVLKLIWRKRGEMSNMLTMLLNLLIMFHFLIRSTLPL